jgi:hypothetical protein
MRIFVWSVHVRLQISEICHSLLWKEFKPLQESNSVSKSSSYVIWTNDRYSHRPVMSNPGLYDPTSIMNAESLSKCQREGWIKLGFYVVCFFFYLYGWVSNCGIFCGSLRHFKQSVSFVFFFFQDDLLSDLVVIMPQRRRPLVYILWRKVLIVGEAFFVDRDLIYQSKLPRGSWTF